MFDITIQFDISVRLFDISIRLTSQVSIIICHPMKKKLIKKRTKIQNIWGD